MPTASVPRVARISGSIEGRGVRLQPWYSSTFNVSNEAASNSRLTFAMQLQRMCLSRECEARTLISESPLRRQNIPVAKNVDAAVQVHPTPRTIPVMQDEQFDIHPGSSLTHQAGCPGQRRRPAGASPQLVGRPRAPAPVGTGPALLPAEPVPNNSHHQYTRHDESRRAIVFMRGIQERET